MKLRTTIISSFLLILYSGVLLHNVIPHVHSEEAEHTVTHRHQHSTDAHDHHESSDEPSSEDTHAWSDFAPLFTHVTLGINHFSNFTGTSYSFVPVVVVVLLCLGILWRLLSLHQANKPPDEEPCQRLQLLCLSAASRRGPPSFS